MCSQKDSSTRDMSLSKQSTVATVVAFLLLALVVSTEAFVPSGRHSAPNMRCLKKMMRFSSSNGNNDETQIPTKNDNAEPKQQEYEIETWNPLRLMVLKLGFTELRWTSPFNYGERDGVFNCALCGLELFDTNGKYDSGSGWPSFWRSSNEGNVDYKKEWDGRLECRCSKCSGHLGHVFLDGPLPGSVPKNVYETSPPSDPRGRQGNGRLPRFCVNGASLKFEERGE
mmetsp:Transcript_5435/g.13660  ORF Transcript_5435/g.13660 Transcript_5435/m.13660 type:complete len:227 (+) Transcript_5435:83-763(+)